MRRLTLSLAAVSLIAWTTIASAQVYSGNLEGITVYGSGELRAKPNFVEISLKAAARAELTDDAIVKFKDSKQRTLDAFTALKMKNLTVHETGLTLAPGNIQQIMQQMWNGMPQQNAKKPEIEISSALHLQLSEVANVPSEELLKTIGKLLDTASDSGAEYGPSQAEMQMAYRYGRNVSGVIVKFILRDLEAIREKVYEKAVEDARTRAERLAKLHGLKLGPAIAVQEVQVSGDETGAQQVVQPWDVATNSDTPVEPQIVSNSFNEIPFRVKLMVRFSTEPQGSKTASK
jgi:uncharacterized protein YggE